jgi:DNA-binding MarR family transcriptional regulator
VASRSTNSQIIHLLKRVHLGTRRAFDEALAEYSLTGPQAEMIGQICMQDGIEQRTLQERMSITSPTLTGIIDGLVERGFVERRVSHEDARVKQLFLTPKGHGLDDVLPTTLDHVAARLLAGFSPSECALLQDWLSRVATNLNADSDEMCG